MKLALAAIAVLATACAGPSVQYAPTNRGLAPAPPRLGEAVLVLFTPPSCPYVEIGYLETTPPVLQTDWTIPEKLQAMRAAAGRNGADAILVIDHQDGGGGHHASYSHNYAAVALAFADPACFRPSGTASAGPRRPL